MNPLVKLAELGQSIWLDYIRRDLVTGGELDRMIREDGLKGITSNPSIFQKAIAGSGIYDADIRGMVGEGKGVRGIFDALCLRDVRDAADKFRPLYDRLGGADGYVSLEVNPHLSRITAATIREANRLWALLDRPNVFIKVPGTAEGLPAIRQLVSDGINVNVTLLFGVPRYREVVEAYMAGLEDRLARGMEIRGIASVASFFVSRIDTLVDSMLDVLPGGAGLEADTVKKIRGQVATASAKVAYQVYREAFSSARFNKLAEKGAGTQRVLWASTSTKNPAYSDLKYLEPLIGPDTVNTVTVETLNAYRDHGKPENRINQDVEESRLTMALLPGLGIDIDRVTRQLEDEGVAKFQQSYDELMASLEAAVEKYGAGTIPLNIG